jgi:acetyl-CoA carboxylase biotin carboxyl carrier protein
MEKEGFRIRLKKGGDSPATVAYLQAPAQANPGPAIAAPAAGAPVEKVAGREITSPMVGTYYAGASPEASAYVEVGMEVTEETVVCIIEAMKVMNEIKAETRGVITEVLAENGKPVQFGQVLFRLR